jgi:hypothetical protein
MAYWANFGTCLAHGGICFHSLFVDKKNSESAVLDCCNVIWDLAISNWIVWANIHKAVSFLIDNCAFGNCALQFKKLAAARRENQTERAALGQGKPKKPWEPPETAETGGRAFRARNSESCAAHAFSGVGVRRMARHGLGYWIS